MAGKEQDSFDPKTWLDPKPRDQSDGDSAGEIDFNPHTWVQPGTSKAEEPQPARKSGKLYATVGGGVLAIVALGAGLAWNGEAETESPLVATEEAAALALPEPTEAAERTFSGRQRFFTVSGYSGLVQMLIDQGVPVEEAGALGREAIAALDSGDQEMEIEIWLAAGDTGQETQFMEAALATGAKVELTRRSDGGFDRRDVFAEIQTAVRQAEGRMGDTDFYSAAVVAGMPDSLVTPFVKIFSYDFSFADEVNPGDTFIAMWEEQVTDDGQVIDGSHRLLYARMVTDKGDREYYSFLPPGAVEAQWFDPSGQANVRSLMRTPVDGARISSQFGMRNHPIRRQRILHGGVDFAAPKGTPIYASGDATVEFRAPAGGAGNLIRLDHGDGMITRYLHLNAFREGLAVGQRVRQGEIIGYVGNTGNSTGPHLHYEIIVNGEKLDPLTFETTKVEPLEGEGLTMFQQEQATVERQLD